jgi:hypothetical protein
MSGCREILSASWATYLYKGAVKFLFEALLQLQKRDEWTDRTRVAHFLAISASRVHIASHTPILIYFVGSSGPMERNKGERC